MPKEKEAAATLSRLLRQAAIYFGINESLTFAGVRRLNANFGIGLNQEAALRDYVATSSARRDTGAQRCGRSSNAISGRMIRK
jgi:hypothetical protein